MFRVVLTLALAAAVALAAPGAPTRLTEECMSCLSSKPEPPTTCAGWDAFKDQWDQTKDCIEENCCGDECSLYFQTMLDAMDEVEDCPFGNVPDMGDMGEMDEDMSTMMPTGSTENALDELDDETPDPAEFEKQSPVEGTTPDALDDLDEPHVEGSTPAPFGDLDGKSPHEGSTMEPVEFEEESPKEGSTLEPVEFEEESPKEGSTMEPPEFEEESPKESSTMEPPEFEEESPEETTTESTEAPTETTTESTEAPTETTSMTATELEDVCNAIAAFDCNSCVAAGCIHSANAGQRMCHVQNTLSQPEVQCTNGNCCWSSVPSAPAAGRSRISFVLTVNGDGAVSAQSFKNLVDAHFGGRLPASARAYVRLVDGASQRRATSSSAEVTHEVDRTDSATAQQTVQQVLDTEVDQMVNELIAEGYAASSAQVSELKVTKSSKSSSGSNAGVVAGAVVAVVAVVALIAVVAVLSHRRAKVDRTTTRESSSTHLNPTYEANPKVHHVENNFDECEA